MIYRHTDQQLQGYFDSPAINQSALKVIIDQNGGIEKFVELQESLINNEDDFYEERKHFIIGKAVDCILSQGHDTFKNKYHHTDLAKKPSATVMAIVREVFYKISETTSIESILPFVSYKKEIYDVANRIKDEKGKIGYSMNRAAPTEKQLKENPAITDWWNYDNRWSSMKYAQEYWADLIEANGKQVLDDIEWNVINNIVISLTTHKHTKHLFLNNSDIDIVFQFPMFWECFGEQCKGLIDHLIIDHKNKRIKPIDEKTLGDYILKFPQAVKKRRYDIQGSYYVYGLNKNLDKLSSLIGKDVTNYSVAHLAFVVESTIKQGVPLVFPMTAELDSIGAVGEGKYLKGWQHAITEYSQWKAINYSIEERFKSSNGVVWIDNNFEIANK